MVGRKNAAVHGYQRMVANLHPAVTVNDRLLPHVNMLTQLDGAPVGVEDHALAEFASFADRNRATPGCLQTEVNVSTVADNAVRAKVNAGPPSQGDAPRGTKAP